RVAVRDDGQAAEAEQVRAAVRVGVEALPQPSGSGTDEEPADGAARIGGDLLAECVEQRGDRPLEELERDVPGEAVGDDDVGRAAAFAPASISTDGPRRAGMGTAMAGRMTPGMRRSSSRPAANTAPVLPAETTASASPSATARTADTSELSGFARTASAGLSS